MIESIVVEGFWDCDECSKRNNGTNLYCHYCQKERPENVRFYLPDDISNLKRHDTLGNPDWICKHCKNHNISEEDICVHCNTHRYEDKHMIGEDVKDAPTHDTNISVKEYSVNTKSSYYQQYNIAQYKKPAIIAIAVITISCLLYWGFRERTIDVIVNSVYWERVIDIYDYVKVTEEGENVPFGAVVINSREVFDGYEKKATGRKIPITKYHSKQVQDGTKQEPYSEMVQQGTKQESYSERVQSGTERYETGKVSGQNGKFQITYGTRPTYTTVTKYRTVPNYVTVTKYKTVPKYKTIQEPYTDYEPEYIQVPDFDTIYTYTIDRLKRTNQLVERGYKGKREPIWPNVVGTHIKVDKSEHFKVSFKDINDGKSYDLNITFNDYDKYNVGSRYKAVINNFGTLTIKGE